MACVFCDIIAGKAPAVRVYEDADYVAFLDIRPFSRGHTLVVPKQHYENLVDTPPDVVAGMAKLGQRIAQASRESGLHADGNNIAINDGKAAFQTVFHIHLHVVPRKSGDKLGSPRACCCAAIRTGKPAERSYWRRWRAFLIRRQT